MNPAVRIKDLLEWFLYGPARKRGLCCGRSRGPAELGKARDVCLMMIDRDLEGRGGAHQYGRWPDPWRPEDDWGPITGAAIFLIILAGLIVYGSGVHL